MASKIARICPECGLSFVPKHAKRQFCTTEHQKAYNNRQLARGQALASLVMAWRGARSIKDKDIKKYGSLAMAAFCRMADQFNAEDFKAGRVSALKVLRRRDANHLIDLA
jgi:hypothetical protein